MPELPEVTTVIEILKTEILNKTINKIDILYPNTIKSDIASFKNDLINRCREIISKYKSVKGMQKLEVKFNSDYIDTFQKEMFENISYKVKE